MRTAMALLLLVVAAPARADGNGVFGPPESFEPRLDPDTARWVSLATTTAGLGLTAYLWRRADRLEEGYGRAELQLASVGTGLATLGIGPAAGLLAAGEYRRGLTGALSRPFVVGTGLLGVGMGAFVGMWGCFETSDCTGAKVAAVAIGGAGVLVAAGGVAWGFYDLWDTPRMLRRRMPKRTVVAPLVGTDRVGIGLTIVH